MTGKIKKALRTARGILFTDPNLLYKEERHLVNQPFYFKGINSKGVLLIHGWSSTPYEVRRLGKYLNENGYTTYGPTLSGHGTVPKDLEKVSWEDWLDDIERAYLKIKNECNDVYVVGTSIGSNLAILLASYHPEIKGLVLLATPYKLRFEKFAVFFAKIMHKFKRYNKKYYPPTFGVSTTITRLISYQTYPISNVLETFELIKESRVKIPSISTPCLIMQSSSDHIVSKNSLEEIYKRIGSKVKEKEYIKRAYHTFISDIKNEHVFKDILGFINKIK